MSDSRAREALEAAQAELIHLLQKQPAIRETGEISRHTLTLPDIAAAFQLFLEHYYQNALSEGDEKGVVIADLIATLKGQ